MKLKIVKKLAKSLSIRRVLTKSIQDLARSDGDLVGFREIFAKSYGELARSSRKSHRT